MPGPAGGYSDAKDGLGFFPSLESDTPLPPLCGVGKPCWEFFVGEG